MKSINKNLTDCAPQMSTCIEWRGGAILALGIEDGDCLNDVVTAIATKAVAAAQPYDLSTVNLQCIIDLFDVEAPQTKSLINIIKLLVANDCTLHQLITNLSDSINNQTQLVLDLKCLAEYDTFGNQLPYTEQTVFQGLINGLCLNQSLFTTLSGRVTNLQNDFDNLDINPYVEPSLTVDTLYTNKPTSQATKITGEALVELRNAIGSTAEIQAALGQQDATFDSKYQTKAGWTVLPTTAAEMWANMQIVLSDLSGRIKSIETNCCGSTCDDIHIGFSGIFQNNNLVLVFNNLYGTKIPSAYTDSGSTFTVTDETGSQISGNLAITNDYSTEEINVSSLKKGSILTINVNTKFTSDANTCQGCYSAQIKYIGDCCVISNGGSADITITYRTPTVQAG